MASSASTKIGVATATIIGMNAMIGSGIFSAPAAMAANVGPAGILAYIMVVVAVWFMAQSLARLAQLFPEEGSFYTYAKQWSGHTGGLIACGAYFVGLLIAMGLLSQMAGIYLQVFIPQFSTYTLGLGVLITLVALNMFGVVLSELGQHILIVCTVFPLITTTLMCLTKFNPTYLTPFAPYGMGNVFKATRVVIFGFFGFESAASLFNIVHNPKRNVPRALTYSIAIVGTIYTLFIGSLIASTPLATFTEGMKVTDILAQTFPGQGWVITLLNISILSAIVGTIHSMIWGASSLLISLVHKMKSGVAQSLISTNILNPSTAVLAVGLCIGTSYLTLKNLDLFFNLTALFIVFANIMSMISLLFIKKEWQSGQNIKTLLGIATASLIFAFACQGLLENIVN